MRTTPQRVATTAVLLATVMAGCETSPTEPKPIPPPVTTPAPVLEPATLSGVVREHRFDGVRVLPGVPVLILGSPPSVWGTNWREVLTGPDGRFEFRSLPAPSFVSIRLGANHSLPCGGHFVWLSPPETTFDVEAVLAPGVPASHPDAGVSGRVVEKVGATIVPVPGARVDLWGEEEFHLASVRETDEEGRFGFCAQEWPLWVSAGKDGYQTRWSVAASREHPDQLEVELVRSPVSVAR